MIRLHDLGFGPKLASSIYQYYGAETLNVLDKNLTNLCMTSRDWL